MAVGGGFQEPSGDGEGRVERQLASFAFVREDREREVRLHFRDVPAGELAVSFRRSGALLITLSGERAGISVATSDSTLALDPSLSDEGSDVGKSRRRKQVQGIASSSTPSGEVTMRYFYSLGDLVYTVSIAAATGVVQSIAGIYPNASLPERELSNRLGVVFTGLDAHTEWKAES